MSQTHNNNEKWIIFLICKNSDWNKLKRQRTIIWLKVKSFKTRLKRIAFYWYLIECTHLKTNIFVFNVHSVTKLREQVFQNFIPFIVEQFWWNFFQINYDLPKTFSQSDASLLSMVYNKHNFFLSNYMNSWKYYQINHNSILVDGRDSTIC
jgi:hypothetical protein